MTRRQWLAAGSLLWAGSCRSGRGNGYPGYALVATAGEKSIAVADLTGFRLVKEVPVGAPPSAIVANTQDGQTFVLTPSTGSVHRLDRALNLASSRKLSAELSVLRLSAGGKSLFAISSLDNLFLEIDASTLRPLGRIRLPFRPRGFDVAQNGAIAILGEGGKICLMGARTSAKIETSLNVEIGEVKFRADGNLLLAANKQEQLLTALSVPGLQRISDLPLPMKPENLCFNADQGQLLVTGEGMDAVAIVFPYRILEVEQTVLAGRDPGVMACSADPAYLFVASASGSDVCIMNLDTRKVIGIVEVGQKPSYITVTPDSQYALVLNELSGDMAVIHIAAVQANTGNASLKRNKSAAALFTVIPVGNRPVHAAVVPRYV